jgi:uncharacterized membrane protein
MAERRKGSLGRRLMAGVFTAAPLVVTWIIIAFLFQQLSQVGRPLITGLARAVRPASPEFAAFLNNEVLQSLLAVMVVLAGLYVLGWFAERVIGRRIIQFFEALVQRIPLIDTIYRATKRFLEVASTSEDRPRQRVVLISFPSPEMRAVGLLTQTLKDKDTGDELAVVYVPTAPNPTSGYLEILPMKDVIVTDWTFEEAMAFTVTAGSNAPADVNYRADRMPPPAHAAGDDKPPAASV